MSQAEPIAGRLEIGEILQETTRLGAEQLQEARERAAHSGGRLLDVLIELGYLEEAEALEALGRQLDLPVRGAIAKDDVEESLVGRVPIGFAKAHGLVPLTTRENGSVRIAISDPFDTTPIDDLRLLFDGADVETELASRRSILEAINLVYDRGAQSARQLAEDADKDLAALADEISHEPADLLDATDEEAPIVRLVNSLLQQAVKERASDIHLEPFEKEIRVRFRVDDILYEPTDPMPRSLQSSITSRIKIMGGLNIAEKRLPQDGRIRLKIAGRDYDVRLSTVPIAHGERVVMRLLPRTTDMLNLERVGFDGPQLEVWEKLIKRPNGIILVTGPTGSGKTTTLYSALARINHPDKNIITIEDPVEIQLPGIGQIEVSPKIGLSFAAGLRSVLRQDPNVVLVGEIRDLETAEIAIQASLTGHLVFSTLHTNDSASAITRLVDMGVEPYLVASSLVAVLAQRLVRVLCTDCRVAVEPTPAQLAEIGVKATPDLPPIYEPGSCARCNHTGYLGRVGIFELLLVDDDIRKLVSQNIDSKSIKRLGMQKGMNALRADGAKRVLDGTTSIAEVLRATEDEGVLAQI